MGNIAILVGNSKYDRQRPLACCVNDIAAMRQLLVASEKYDSIEIVENASASDLKSKIRDCVSDDGRYEEIFFYFTGHGVQTKSDFYFCSVDFDELRPNETGLSHKELLDFVRVGSPETFVLVTDACNSGTLVIKGEGGFLPTPKDVLRNYIQIASCLDFQVSLSGDPLSEFTEHFCQAALKKLDGPVYYSDIISVLRDEYMEDGNQTPFFVHQGTMRQYLAQDAKSFELFRKRFNDEWLPEVTQAEEGAGEGSNILDFLRRAENKFADEKVVLDTVENIFRHTMEGIDGLKLEDMFDVAYSYSSDFYDDLTIEQIIEILYKESRPDEFVSVRRKKPIDRSPLGLAMPGGSYIQEFMFDPKLWELKLNFPLEKAQMIATLSPKFKSLKKLSVRVSCAPSLLHLYLFSSIVEYRLSDMGNFKSEGSQSDKRWYKVDWGSDPLWVSQKYIAKDLNEVVQKQIAAVRKMIGEG